MYITKTTNQVNDIFKELDNSNDIMKLKFLLYLFNCLNNNQINSKNEINPSLIEDDSLNIFNLSLLGIDNNNGISFIQHNISLYNHLIGSNEGYEDCGNVMGIDFNQDTVLKFEKLSLQEKVDVFSELMIRYDNETYFNHKLVSIQLDNNQSGYDIANTILKLKEEHYFEN